LIDVKKTPPTGMAREGGVRMEHEEMIEILEAIVRDENTNPTARCTAIRTLVELDPQPRIKDAEFAELYGQAPARRKHLEN
jgi:vesicle coat complex subunit